MNRRALSLVACVALMHAGASAPARGYVLNHTISSNGGCPQLNRFRIAAGVIDRRWSTSLHANLITSATETNARLNEIEQTILRSFSVWTSVTGTTLIPSTLGNLARTGTQNACNFSDGLNTICFNQADNDGFQSGVLAFTRVATSQSSVNAGEILDSDVYFRPRDAEDRRFATPSALTAGAFDLESVLIHELGHFFGFSHSSVWRAMMWPFAPPRGQFTGDRPTPQRPDAPLADDDRVGLRVLYPDASDTVNAGTIRGRVLPANPDMAGLPAGVTGIFGAHVVAVDADTGAVVAGTFAGWTCSPSDLPTRFDGSYVFERLPLGRTYKLYAEPMDGPTNAGHISLFLDSLCRAGTNNACSVPAVNSNFTTRVKP
jgi:hypothetical protein